jgi:hypothetical protein
MKRFTATALVALGALATMAGGRASAQAPFTPGIGLTPRPVVSPYINLLRRDQPLWLNYYGLVRPEIGARLSIAELQQEQAALGQALASGSPVRAPTAIRPTGNVATFMDFGGYYGGGGGRIAGGRGNFAVPAYVPGSSTFPTSQLGGPFVGSSPFGGPYIGPYIGPAPGVGPTYVPAPGEARSGTGY